MPNWCSNSISITGPKDKIKALWDAAQKDEQSGGGLLQAMHPMPASVGDEKTTDSVMPDWYTWRVNNWGTKWEISNEGLEYSEDGDLATISGWFESAWAPPTGAIEAYGEANEDVRIELSYHEPGMCFVGKATVEDGSMDDDYYEYSGHSSDTVRDAIGADLDDEWNISEEMAQYEEENEDE